MSNINDLYSAHAAKRAELSAISAKIKEHERLIDKHKDAIRRLEKRGDKLWDQCDWVKMLVYPIASALKEYTGADRYKVYGPFGLRAGTSIYVQKGHKCGGITLTADVAWRLRYDTGEKTGDYQNGSISELNGFNNVTAPLPDTIPEIAALLRWFDKEI